MKKKILTQTDGTMQLTNGIADLINRYVENVVRTLNFTISWEESGDADNSSLALYTALRVAGIR